MVEFALLNELSLPFENEYDAQNGFKDFLFIVKKLKDRDIQKIRVEDEVKNLEIVHTVFMPQFFGQLRDRELKDRLRAFIANSIIVIETPFIKEDEQESEELLTNEYFFNGSSTKGALACCDIWDSIVISFNSARLWEDSFIKIEKETIDEYCRKSLNIPNISKNEHFEEHKDFFDRYEEWIKEGINRDNFFKKRDELFKNRVVICDEVEKQIKKIDTKIFSQALTILRDIDNGKALKEFVISGEGESVKSNPRLRSLRMFTINGKKEFFEKHIKNLSDGYRIHFFEQSDKIYIGYIGKHLLTKNF